MTKKNQILGTETIDEAIALEFGKVIQGRGCVLEYEGMEGEVAREYDQFGIKSRNTTYRNIAEDFIERCKYDGRSLLDVGCGSGLLLLELAKKAKDEIAGIDASGDMVNLGKGNIGKSKFKEKIRLHKCSVYDLKDMKFPFIVCRNVLHRFRNPRLAISKMHDSLEESGVLYIRDLRRDSDWKTVIERIGNDRWQSKTLVRDYIGAMAGMLTIDELEDGINSLGITNYCIGFGSYSGFQKENRIKEYQNEVEYVCIIRKKSRVT